MAIIYSGEQGVQLITQRKRTLNVKLGHSEGAAGKPVMTGACHLDEGCEGQSHQTGTRAAAGGKYTGIKDGCCRALFESGIDKIRVGWHQASDLSACTSDSIIIIRGPDSVRADGLRSLTMGQKSNRASSRAGQTHW